MQIKWTKRASQNLYSIIKYIETDNPIVAKEFYMEIIQKIKVLENFPLLGRLGIVPETREFVVHENYIVYYRILEEHIQILRVLHAKRKYP